MKAAKQYFPVVLFIMMYTVVPTFECVDKILTCDYQVNLLRTVRSCTPLLLFAERTNTVLDINFFVCFLQDSMLIYGGQTENGADKSLWLFNVTTLQWNEV